MQSAGHGPALLLLSLALGTPVAQAQIVASKTILLMEDQVSGPAVEAVASALETDLTLTQDGAGRRSFVQTTLPLVSTAADVPVFGLIDRTLGRDLVAIGAVVLLEAALLAYLLIERRKRRRAQQALELDIAERKKAEAALIDLSRNLINAREEEQSRIARELHDDFNQRLAVLAIRLKTTSMLVTRDPAGASQRMDELCEEAGDIAGDLHKLSHNLHSSVLYSLGLVDGIQSLCTEFAEQHGIEVEFTAHDVPRDLARESSLCLFRIAQEGLRNVKKHSGASNAYIDLRGNEKEIVLSVLDWGRGFDDQDSSFKAGLGLRSMKERMRTVRGTIQIQSRRSSGTKITARMPLLYDVEQIFPE